MVTRRTTAQEIPPEGDPETAAVTQAPGWGVPVSTRATNADAIDADDDDATESLISQFVGALSEPAADRLRVKVYRINDVSGKLEYCRDMLPGQFKAPDMLERLRVDWGPGEYEFRLIGSAGIMKRLRQSVANPLGPVAAIAAPAQSSDAMAQALAMLAQGQNAIIEALNRRPDPREEMRANLEMLALMRNAFAPAAAPAAPALDPMAMFSQVVGMIRESKKTIAEFADDEREEKDPLGAAIPKLIETASALVLKANAPQPMPTIAAPASLSTPRENPEEVIPQSDVTEETADMTNPAMLLLRGYVDDLLDMIARNETPEKGGEYIAQNIPEEFDAYLTNRYWFEFIAANFPQLTQHEAWVRAAKAHADKLMSDPEENDAAQG